MPPHAKLDDAEYSEVVDEMNRILADPKFGSSQRCVKLLRRLIEHALAGTPEIFKERTLGVEVFKRDANYDTNADPVVRMAASEIRRRLAQYYEEPNHQRVVVVRLHPGSYLPEFDFSGKWEDLAKGQVERRDPATSIEEAAAPLLPGSPGVATAPNAHVSLWRSRRLWGAAFLLIAGITYLAFPPLFQWNKYAPWKLLSDRRRYIFWEPLIDSSSPVILCISGVDLATNLGLDNGHRADTDSKASTALLGTESGIGQTPLVVFHDVSAAHNIALALRGFGEISKERLASTLNFPDLRKQSVIFVGGFDNPWSVSMLSTLRFSLHFDPLTGDRWIQDAQNPSRRDWKLDGNATYVHTDYAVIARLFDQETSCWHFVFSGLSSYGTVAASDLVTDRTLTQLIPSSVPAGKNQEVVIETEIVNNTAGTPRVLSVYTW